MPWRNSQYPFNSGAVPMDAVCECCGRPSGTHHMALIGSDFPLCRGEGLREPRVDDTLSSLDPLED
jgi:hypothetical protein